MFIVTALLQKVKRAVAPFQNWGVAIFPGNRRGLLPEA